MNQSTQASSQDNQDKKELAPGEFVYEFFQPVFESTFSFDFSTSATSAPPASEINSPPTSTINAPTPAIGTHLAESTPMSTACAPLETFSSDVVSQITQQVAPQQVAQPISPIAPQAISRTAIDESGAVISFGRWNIRPHRIQYPDRSVAEFEYDESERLVRVLDRDGMEWVRVTQPDHQNISTWKSAEGQTCEMSMVVIPDGTYQVISAAGVIQTCALSGRIVVWTPFTAGFDLKRTLFAIFRSIDKNQDSSLSKEELELAARQIWNESDAIQLISMMQSHFDAICASRRHALCRQGTGITIDDILAFDETTKAEQESRCEAPPHIVKLVQTLFDELCTSETGTVTLDQVRLAYDKRHQRDNVSKVVLQTMYEEMRNQFESKNALLISKASYLNRTDFVQHFKAGYKKQIQGQIKIAGWGSDECWQAGETTTRTLFVDPSNPIDSILPQAIQRRVSDPLLNVFYSIFESMIVQCPHIILRMISQTVDGKFKVAFPGEQTPVIVSAPSSSCLAEYVHGSKYGFWMAVIENAFKQYESERKNASDLDHLHAVERICKLLTGQGGRWVSTTDMQLTELNIFMRDVFKQRRTMIAVGERNSPRMIGNRFISKSAVCGIVNFDNKNGRVTVSDPLRDNSADNFSDHTHRNSDGSTTLSVNAFSNAFEKIYVEEWLASDHLLQSPR